MGIDHIINEYHHLMKKENFGCKNIMVRVNSYNKDLIEDYYENTISFNDIINYINIYL